MGARATATQATATNSFEEAPVDDNRFGKLSELRVRAEARGGRTAVPELYATMPFKVDPLARRPPFPLRPRR